MSYTVLKNAQNVLSKPLRQYDRNELPSSEQLTAAAALIQADALTKVAKSIDDLREEVSKVNRG